MQRIKAQSLLETILRGLVTFVVAVMSTMVISVPSFAEGDGNNGGDAFRKAAIEYSEKASKFTQKGYSDVAKLYSRLAEIKRHAAKLADENRWDELDWTEYEELSGRVENLLNKKKD